MDDERVARHDLQRCGSQCFESIMSSCWSIISTLTTAGYGDSYPISALGRIVAGLAACVGIVVIAMPISVFEYNFTRIYLAREVCTKMIRELTAGHTHEVITADVLKEYLDMKIAAGQLSPQEEPAAVTAGRFISNSKKGRVSAATRFSFGARRPSNAEVGKAPLSPLARLSPQALIKLYDIDGRGFLSEEEALLMLADIDEFHQPNDTSHMNAAVQQIQGTLDSISHSLNELESRLMGSKYAAEQAARQMQIGVPESQHATSAIARWVQQNVKREFWFAPMPLWMSQFFSHCGRKPESETDYPTERSELEWNLWMDRVIDDDELRRQNSSSLF